MKLFRLYLVVALAGLTVYTLVVGFQSGGDIRVMMLGRTPCNH
jgi:hypothetical protein